MLSKSKKRLHDGKVVENKAQHNTTEKVKNVLQYPKVSSVLSQNIEIKRKRNVLYYLMLSKSSNQLYEIRFSCYNLLFHYDNKISMCEVICNVWQTV